MKLRSALPQLSARPSRLQPYRWLGPGVGWLLVLLWNWRLGLALLLAAATVLAHFWATLPEGRLLWQRLRTRLAQVWGLAWVRSVGLGAAVLLGSYTAFSVWQENPHHWEAIAGIGQELALLGVLSLLAVDLWQRRQWQQQQTLERCWEQLQAPSPQKRLLAVRTLQTLVHPGDPETARLALEMVQLGLEREESGIVRGAMLEAVQMWRQGKIF
ncbi:MAG: hypothetical protein Q6J68_01230 [Thermostichales cyanobacterium SZTDM-1c_bins_54]